MSLLISDWGIHMKWLFENKKTLSFEVFPPKKEEDFPNVYETLKQLSNLAPDFISVTYGAGGSKSKKTVDIASYIQNKLNINAIAHVTCVGNKKEDIDNVTNQLIQHNINCILALRGDRPTYMSDEQYLSRDFNHADEMIAYIKKENHFHLLAACYPEKHYESPDFDTDLNYLRQKVNAGAEVLISQLFFDNELFYRFCEKANTKGIEVPILAGIMPITSSKQLGTTVSLSGSSVPKKLSDMIATYGDNPEDMKKAGIEYAINQITDLQSHMVDGIHLYSMNKLNTTTQIVNAIR